MAVTLNRAAFEYAKRLVAEGRFSCLTHALFSRPRGQPRPIAWALGTTVGRRR
jgi:hypothetical protein